MVCGQHSHIAVRIHEVERSGAQVKQADDPCDAARMAIITVKLKRIAEPFTRMHMPEMSEPVEKTFIRRSLLVCHGQRDPKEEPVRFGAPDRARIMLPDLENWTVPFEGRLA